jgi:lysylphosphatidylglycerol synthetase-like protein (DUF2156 family)
MGLFFGARVGRGLFIGARGKDAAFGVLIWFALVLLAAGWVLSKFIENWLIISIIGGSFFAIWVVVEIGKEKRRQEQASKGLVLSLADDLERAVFSARGGKTSASRLKACDKAINLLAEIKSCGEFADMVQDRFVLAEEIVSLKKVIPILPMLQKAERQNFMRKEKAELNHLLEILFEAKKENVLDCHLAAAGVGSDIYGSPLTIFTIKKRAGELGWVQQ